MKKFIASTLTIAFLTAVPASAQLLGGAGGLGGSLGGSLGGGLGSTMGSDTINRTTGSVTGRGGVASSTQIDRTIDTRSGRVATDANSSSSANGSLIGAADLPTNSVNGAANGTASGSANGGADATLLGTDAVRSTAGQAVGTARNIGQTAKSTAGGAASTVAGTAGNAVSSASTAGSLAGNASGNASGTGSGMAMGNLGQLAASGSSAANASGMFSVMPGMPIEDPKGRVVGYVQTVQQTGSGIVQSVVVEAGNRTATLPAASFAGSGDVLVTAMSKGEIKKAAKSQEAQSEASK
ncbi:MAG: hypothetical protein V7676_09090 [Parasphingorhabdus sp.]|uniref:hypothetical protein n=1 Tax=Parasphingorhabdus sp. TaxID=2709688 RepID=UPI0030035249